MDHGRIPSIACETLMVMKESDLTGVIET